VFGSDRIGISIEVNEIARPDVHSASAEARSTRVETIEIYQTLECMPESADVLEAGGSIVPEGCSHGVNGRAAKNPFAPPASETAALIWLRRLRPVAPLAAAELGSPMRGQSQSAVTWVQK
jgi:hypothetical protein